MNQCTIWFVCLSVLLCGCKSQKEKKEDPVFSESFSSTIDEKEYSVVIDKVSDDSLGDWPVWGSVVFLSNDVLLNEIKKTYIVEDRIYILDETPKIVCYTMAGDLVYEFYKQGGGPKEYISIRDFWIDQTSNQMVLFDISKRKLLFYDLEDTSFIKELSTDHMSPDRFAMVDGTFFFSNADHVGYDNNPDHHYNLFYSETGESIEKRFLPHDAIADFQFMEEPFYLNQEQVLYKRPFDYTIYKLAPGEIYPFIHIDLPNRIPLQVIEEKIGHHTLVNSSYSFGVENVYIAGNILHFIFSKDGFIQHVFYDLAADKLLYCGSKVNIHSTKERPYYAIIEGVYQNRFFGLASSLAISRVQEQAEAFSSAFKKYTDDDNPVLIFYEFRDDI